METKVNDDELKLIIGRNIAEYRKLTNFSQVELAEKLNYSDKAVSKWERGESLPDIIVLKKIADFFDISVNDLLATSGSKRRKLAIKKILKNKVLTMLIWVAVVWLVATTCFAFFEIFNVSNRNWLVFLYATTASSVVCVICTAVWRQKFLQMIFASLFIWFAFICICVTFQHTNIWLLLVIAIPIQILFVLIYFFRRRNSYKK